MKNEFDPRLEKLVHQELRRLPSRKAPETLLPRVLATIQAQAARPWWQKSWWHWPLLAQVAFVLLALAVVLVFSGSGWWIANEVGTLWQTASERLLALLDGLAPLTNAGLLVWNKFFQPWILYGAAMLIIVYCACIGAGTMLVQMACKRV